MKELIFECGEESVGFRVCPDALDILVEDYWEVAHVPITLAQAKQLRDWLVENL